MLDSKFLFTLVGLVVTVFAICNTNMSPSVSESFLQHRKVRTERSCGLGNGSFYKQANLLPTTSPRFATLGLGASVNYDLPDYGMQGVPANPIDLGNMAMNNYDTNNQYHPINRDEEHNEMNDHMSGSLNNIGDMTSINSDGQCENSFVVTRNIFSNKKSRTLGQADMIRGDLKFAKPRGCWFTVSADPDLDLHQGAMNENSLGGNGGCNQQDSATFDDYSNIGYNYGTHILGGNGGCNQQDSATFDDYTNMGHNYGTHILGVSDVQIGA
jgi:hypothetical protein